MLLCAYVLVSFFTGVKYLAAFLGDACFGEESLSGILMSAVDVFMSEEILRSEVDMSTSSRLFSPKNSSKEMLS